MVDAIRLANGQWKVWSDTLGMSFVEPSKRLANARADALMMLAGALGDVDAKTDSAEYLFQRELERNGRGLPKSSRTRLAFDNPALH